MQNFGLVVIGAHSGIHLKSLISEYKDQKILLVELGAGDGTLCEVISGFMIHSEHDSKIPFATDAFSRCISPHRALLKPRRLIRSREQCPKIL